MVYPVPSDRFFFLSLLLLCVYLFPLAFDFGFLRNSSSVAGYFSFANPGFPPPDGAPHCFLIV